ncbi:hypothetical protein GOP47_0020224 [Adiantum capillus-veneris]|uniref:Pentatricopeptide repeat-containing protein n=1 Tax=Adiantum capillus-veneris TaxID=13818 RepID=A0A9D4Z8G7_ADICA|nr:hypothetical protein GOP47_0020224 [Adiantum capillus-veneris]
MCRTRAILRTLCEKGELDKALDLLGSLQKPLPTPIYVSIFKACCNQRALPAAQRLHTHLLHHRVPLTSSLTDHLVLTLARCGALEEAHLASHFLSVFSWTALISAHVDRGHPSKALCLYERVLANGIVPNNYTYVALFKACGAIPDLVSGMQLHADALKKGLASDVFACNTLISMYGKCEVVLDAQCVFESMPERTIVSWNAMLAVIIEEAQGRKALRVFAQMCHEQVGADQATYVAAIQACAILAEHEGFVLERSSKELALEIGKALHADTKREGIASNAFVGSTLISMYSKSDAITEAEHAFRALLQPNVVTWNNIISAYVEEDEGEKALQLYVCSQDASVTPDQTTYVTVLQACALLAEKEEAFESNSPKSMALQIGQALHADITREGFESVVFVGNTLVTMYGKCVAIAEAEHVFCSSLHTIMSWNAMLSVYVEQGLVEKAFLLYMQMQETSIADERTVVMVLLACIKLAEKEEALVIEGQSVKVMSLEIGRGFHADVCKNGAVSDTYVGTTLISMYAMCGDINGAEFVFGSMLYRDLPAWNSFLSACVEQNFAEKALLLYRQMLEDGVTPNQRTFVILLQACVSIAEKEDSCTEEGLLTKGMTLSIGLALHADCENYFWSVDVFVGNSLIGMYGKCGSMTDAELVFGSMSQRDIVSWNVLVSAYVDLGQEDNALRLYRQMQEHLVTHVTLTRILQACSATGSLDYCRHLHFEVISAGYDQNSSIAATLVSAYGGCSSMLDTQVVFSGIPEPDLTTWNACIAGHAGDGNFLLSFYMFERMRLMGTIADGVTFIKIISACARTGLVVDGLEFFESARLDYGVLPDMKHYGCLLDLLGRTGDFKRLESFLERAPMQADVTFWLGLLGACTRGNLELGEKAFKNAVSLQPEQSTPYVLMSNIYADAGLQECSAELERARRQHCANNSGLNYLGDEQPLCLYSEGG